MENIENNSNATAAAFIFMLIGTTASGYFTWQFIQPKSFGSGVGFLVCWLSISWLANKISSMFAFAIFSHK